VSALSELTPSDEAMLEALKERHDYMVERTKVFCAYQTGSYNLEGLRRFAPILADAFSELKGELRLIESEPVMMINDRGLPQSHETGPIITVSKRPYAAKQVVLTGHYDTVYAPGHFDEVHDLGDRLHGPGVADMKGGLVVMLEALRIFETFGPSSDVGYRIVLTPDEETGNFASQSHIVEAAKDAHIGMTYEPAFETGAMSGARKGSAVFDIVFHGRAAHAGRNPEEGRSALSAASEFVMGIDALIQRRAGVTFNVGRIDGGGAVNIVPDLAVVRLGVRAPDEQSAQWATKQVEDLAQKAFGREGIHGHVYGGFYRPPKPKNKAQTSLWALSEEMAKPLGLRLDWIDTGGVCEGNNVFAAGVPNLDTLGVRGGRIHSPEEFMIKESLVERASLSALMLGRIGDGRMDVFGLKDLMKQ
jgi:glutamate carboxypeptidase